MGQPEFIDDGQNARFKPNRLLVIDDEPNICDVVSTIAEQAGYAVSATTSASEFKKMIPSLKPTAIVLDVIMPETDGIELMRFLAEQDVRWPILVMSGHKTYLGLSEALGRALGLPSVTAIAKPLDVSQIQEFLSENSV